MGWHQTHTRYEAAKAAEWDGIKLIHGIPFVPDGVYLDTPENRATIAQYFEDHRLSLPANPDVVLTLHDRLDENLAEYKAEVLQLGKEALFNSSDEITAVRNSYEYFRNEHAFTTGQAEFLLSFQSPLNLMSDRWSDGIGFGDIKEIVNAVFNDQEWTLKQGGYELADDDSDSDSSAPPASAALPGRSPEDGESKPNGADEKPSVMALIKQARQESKERPAAPKEKDDIDITARNKSEPDL